MPFLPSAHRALAACAHLCLAACLAACSVVVGPDPGRLGGAFDGGRDAGQSTREPDAGADAASCSAPAVVCGGGCVDVMTDDAHCGGCGVRCGVGRSCVSGRCECSGASCPPIEDPRRCGPSGVECAADEACMLGECVCRPGFARVVGGCVDLASDPDDCGAPGEACAEVCLRGECADACPDSMRECDGACVDRSHPLHCGECGRSCGPAEVCVDGDCEAYEPAACVECPCASCGERACCAFGRGAVCVAGERCG